MNPVKIEARLTSNNPAFNGYCVEWWRGEILLAVTPQASRAYDALLSLYEDVDGVVHTVKGVRWSRWVVALEAIK